MELKLYFSDEEMRDFLKRKDYVVKNVKTCNYQSEYHNKVSFYDCEVAVAYKSTEKPSKELLEKK